MRLTNGNAVVVVSEETVTLLGGEWTPVDGAAARALTDAVDAGREDVEDSAVPEDGEESAEDSEDEPRPNGGPGRSLNRRKR